MAEKKGFVSKFFNIFSGEEGGGSENIIDQEQQLPSVTSVDPSDYAEAAELDYIEENDMTAIVSTRKINYGCTLIITRTHEGKDENRIFVKRGTPCAKFIEAMDAHQYTLETADYGTTAVYRRDVIRVPTTPMQLITMSYMQRWGIEEEEIAEMRRQMGYHNISNDDIGYSDSAISTAIKEKLGTVITGSKKKKEKDEEEVMESDKEKDEKFSFEGIEVFQDNLSVRVNREGRAICIENTSKDNLPPITSRSSLGGRCTIFLHSSGKSLEVTKYRVVKFKIVCQFE